MEDFDIILQNFKNEVDNLPAIADGYKKLSRLVQDYEEIKGILRKDTQVLSLSASDLTNKLKEIRSVIESDNKKYHSDIESMLESGFVNNKKLFQSSFDLLSQTADKIDSNNKKFHSEFADSVNLRLDNNKLEIKQLIENEAMKLKNIVSETTNSLIKQTEDKYKKIFTMVCIFGIVNTILFVLLLIFK